jgi:hypothetical protein
LDSLDGFAKNFTKPRTIFVDIHPIHRGSFNIWVDEAVFVIVIEDVFELISLPDLETYIVAHKAHLQIDLIFYFYIYKTELYHCRFIPKMLS